VSTPITLSGFNNIDFGSIVTQLMARERLPEVVLQQQQTTLKSQVANLSELSTKLSALDSAATALAGASSLSGRSVSNSDTSAISVSAGATTPTGTFDIVVNELARAQVTASTSTVADADTTVVANAGTLTIGGVDVTLSGATTLQGLADAINGTSNIGVTASVSQSDATHYALVLTGNQTGSANAFTITNGLSGGSGVTFGSNAVAATDASITVNNVAVTSSTNTFSTAVPGADVTVQRKDPAKTITVTVNADTAAAKQAVGTFVTAYNDLAAFVQNQQTTANHKDAGSLGHDALLRSASQALRQTLGGANTADSTFQYLSAVGVGFSRTGELTFNAATFDQAASSTSGLAHVQSLFAGQGATPGLFDSVHDSLSIYNAADGLVAAAQTARTTRISALDGDIADFEARLAIRETSLRAEFAAADQAISALNSQTNSLTSLGSQYRLF
jgi:flagellar hook-associated protein 2